MANSLIGCLIDWLIDSFIGWLVDWLIDQVIDWWLWSTVWYAAQDKFKFRNLELNSFAIDVDQSDDDTDDGDDGDDDEDDDGGQTLVSRRHAEGFPFIVDETTGRLKTSDGLCVRTGSGP